MIKTATNIIKGVFRSRKTRNSNFESISWSKEKWIKHQEDKAVKELKLNGYTIHYKRPYELLYSYKEIFTNEIYRFQSDKQSPFIIDCGSNIGLSVLYFKKLFPSSTIIAFEPDANNFSLLKQNVKDNKLDNVQLNEAAVWITDGEISFEANESEASHISYTNSPNKVKAVRLKQLLIANNEVDFLKIDIEGAETEVIEDCKEILYKASNIFLEYHGKANETDKLNRLLAIVKDNGFKLYIRNAADNLQHPFFEKATGTIYDVQLNLFCYK